MKLTFYGGAGEVTGSNYLLESGGTKIMIDCGLHQGGRICESPNFKPFPYDPKEIEAVFVTHAHIDHTGRLPQLTKFGFRGRVISTPPTRDFAESLLLDSEHVLLEDAAKCDEAALYDTPDVDRVCGLWEGVPYREPVKIGPFIIEFYNAGHILGSSSIVVSAEGKRVVFSGDLGNLPTPFITGTDYITDADYALIESTYGNRVHEGGDTRKTALRKTITETIKNGGVLMIPAFALERAQELIYEFNSLVESGQVHRVPVFIDSPLAIKLTAVYQKYSRDPVYFSAGAIEQAKRGDFIFNFPGLKMTLTTEESKAINDVPVPKVIIAGAGMSNGGRILHHELRYLPDSKSTILFVGYQARGSLGRNILDDAKMVHIRGEEVPVRAHVVAIGGYSAHADQPQLLKWLEPMKKTLKKVFVVQGEDDEARPFSEKVTSTFGIKTEIPSAGETVML
ncbi:MAG: MBL fold metallo-hydrolase [Candidatus Jorgensenbacteria bacterium]|nr:MBL fold metallo-hydrolase [Candidatus Jorgensenbacteria bacterium]